MIFGLILLVHGIKGIVMASNGQSTRGGMVGSIIMLVIGVFLIIHPLSAVKILMVIVGIALIYDGAVMLHLTDQVYKRARQYQENHDDDIIDVDYKE